MPTNPGHRDQHGRGVAAEDATALYERFTSRGEDGPHWPGVDAQYTYTAASGPALVKRTQDFIEMLDADGAFVPGWRGLDYGAGWGRIASLLLAYGTPDQLDLVDAWDKSIKLLEQGGFANRFWRVSEVLLPNDLPQDEYDFVYAFSVFTHLAPRAFWNNLPLLARATKRGGTVYFTVRHIDLIEMKHPDLVDAVRRDLEQTGFSFMPTVASVGPEPVFGEAVVDEAHLRARCASDPELGPLDYLGKPPHQWQHVYALRR